MFLLCIRVIELIYLLILDKMCELIKIVMLLFLFKFFNNEKSLYLVVGFKLVVGLFKINNLGLCNNV